MGHVCPGTPIVLLSTPLPCCIVPIVTIHGPLTEAVGGLTPRWEPVPGQAALEMAPNACVHWRKSPVNVTAGHARPLVEHIITPPFPPVPSVEKKKKGTGVEEEEREEGGG